MEEQQARLARPFLACEQAPKWGIGRKEKQRGMGASELDFCLRPVPHLGAFSQARKGRATTTSTSGTSLPSRDKSWHGKWKFEYALAQQ